LLLDLASMVDTSKAFGNLLAPFEKDGRLWSVPTLFKFPVFLGPEDKLSVAASLEALTDAVVSGNGIAEIQPGSPDSPSSMELPESERSALYFTQMRDVFDLIWDSSAPEVVKGGSLDTAALQRMLAAVKAISDKYELAAEKDQGARMTAMFSDGGAPTIVPDSVIWYSMGRADYGAFMVSSLPLLALQSERPGSKLAPFPGLATDSFIPAQIAGISADSNAPDVAADFIQTMLSLEVQGVGYGYGLPITKEGLEAQIKLHNERIQEGDGRRGNELDLDVVSAAEGLRQPVLTDEVLTEAVWAEAEKLCKGETDIEKAVKDIEQSIKNYLAERA
jgi:hypothetical protein